MTTKTELSRGQMLKMLRIKRAEKSKKAAKGIGISVSLLSRLENDRVNMSEQVGKKISIYYDIPYPVLVWAGISEEDVPKKKREVFRIIKPAVDKLMTELLDARI